MWRSAPGLGVVSLEDSITEAMDDVGDSSGGYNIIKKKKKKKKKIFGKLCTS